MPRTTKQKPNPVPRPLPVTRPVQVPRPRPRPIPRPNTIPLPVQMQNHSMFETMKQGFSFGVGSSIANNMTKRIFNSKDKEEDKNKEEVKLTTDKMYELYNKCLEKNDKNIDCNIILQKNTFN